MMVGAGRVGRERRAACIGRTDSVLACLPACLQLRRRRCPGSAVCALPFLHPSTPPHAAMTHRRADDGGWDGDAYAAEDGAEDGMYEAVPPPNDLHFPDTGVERTGARGFWAWRGRRGSVRWALRQ